MSMLTATYDTGHPYEPMLAVSGIDHTIKIFSPDGRAREDARNGVGVTPSDSSGFSSLGIGRTRHGVRRPPRTSDVGTTAEENATKSPEDDEEGALGPNGLSSRQRMHLEYRITSQNDVERRGGNREAYLTVQFFFQPFDVPIHALTTLA